MTERKRGKFNIIDGIVIVVILVLIAGAVYKFRGLDKTNKNRLLAMNLPLSPSGIMPLIIFR